MRAPRLMVEGPLAGDSTTLRGDRAHYVSRVLRLRTGAPLVLTAGDGAEYPASVSRLERGQVEVALGARREASVESPLRITVALAVSKGERMDTAVQKSVELGAAAIAPVLSERSVVRLDAQRAARRQAHWRDIARGACEQCGRNRRVEVAPPVTLAAWLASRDRSAAGLVLVPGASQALGDVPAPDGGRLALLIGPEGGLAPAEVEAAVAAGLLAVTLGPRVLRAETAAIAALSAAQALWGDLLVAHEGPPT